MYFPLSLSPLLSSCRRICLILRRKFSRYEKIDRWYLNGHEFGLRQKREHKSSIVKYVESEMQLEARYKFDEVKSANNKLEKSRQSSIDFIINNIGHCYVSIHLHWQITNWNPPFFFFLTILMHHVSLMRLTQFLRFLSFNGATWYSNRKYFHHSLPFKLPFSVRSNTASSILPPPLHLRSNAR